MVDNRAAGVVRSISGKRAINQTQTWELVLPAHYSRRLNGDSGLGRLPDYPARVKKPSDERGRGIMPDYEIKYTVEDYINDNDPVLDFALTLINN